MRNVKIWACTVMRGLRRIGYEFVTWFDTLIPVEVDAVMQLLDAHAMQVWDDIDICPRTRPSRNATLCTYYRWFAGPDCLRHPCQLLQHLVSARCLRLLLRFRMGCHSLPNVSGGWAKVLRPQRLCMRCAQQVIGDKRHLVLECPALQSIRNRYPGLFGANIVIMQQLAFMWQLDNIRVAHFVMDCFDDLDAASPSNQPKAARVMCNLPSFLVVTVPGNSITRHRSCFQNRQPVLKYDAAVAVFKAQHLPSDLLVARLLIFRFFMIRLVFPRSIVPNWI